MNLSDKITLLRKQKGLTQEELADKLEISRQAVSKWEARQALPELDNIVKLAKIFDVSTDYLLGNEQEFFKNSSSNLENNPNNSSGNLISRLHYEYKSKKMIGGVPLVHVNIGWGVKTARGIIAIGNIAQGVISIGLVSLGVLSFGIVSLGLIAFGAFSLALLLGLGAITLGLVAIGAIAIGLFSIGAISVGMFAVGALSLGYYVAYGDHAYAMIAYGFTKAFGENAFLTSVNSSAEVIAAIDSHVPRAWSLLADWIKRIIA